jgi:signal transduction histidine kinase/ligand-binding sensor domain-containing protein
MKSRMFNRIVAWSLVLAGLWTGLAASASAEGRRTIRTDPEYLIDTWEIEDGLPENSATAMAQTPDGYLWFGTFNGLVRFDGVRFVVFDRATTPELPSAGIVNLHCDQSGRLWVSTLRGLAVREHSQWRALASSDGWPGSYVRTFSERNNGDLLMTMFDGPILEIVGGRPKVLPPPPGTGGRGYLGCVDGDGRWWVAQPQFIGRWDGQHWIQALASTATGTDRVGCGAARDGGVWVLMSGDLRKFRRDVEVSRVQLQEKLGGIWSLFEDTRSNLWVCTEYRGVVQIPPGGPPRRWTETNGLASPNTRFAFEDRERTLWIGTSGGGLSRFKARHFQSYGPESGLTGPTVASVWPAGGGDLWIASRGKGLFRLHHGLVVSIPLPISDRSAVYAQTVMADRAGRVWLGTSQDLWVSESTGFHRVRPDQFTGAETRALFEDSRGRIWVGSLARTTVLDGDNLRAFTSDDGAPKEGASAFAEDRQGVVWFSTGNGVFRVENDRVVEFRDRSGALHDISCLKADADGTLWLGSMDRGLLCWMDGRLGSIGLDAGLPVRGVLGIVEDATGHSWIASDRGVVRAASTDLKRVAQGASPHLECRVFDLADGLPSLACASGYQPVCARDERGRVWFATLRGVAMVDPVTLRTNEVPPPVSVEEISFYSPTPPRRDHGSARFRVPEFQTKFASPIAQPVSLPPGSRDIELQYTGLSLAAPEKVRFQVRLEGLDDDWREVTDRRAAHYHELPPRDYVFHVRAANNDGVWNETGTSLAFTVRPYLWQTLWFKVLGVCFAAALVGAVIYVGMRRRVLRLDRESLARQLFARQLIRSQEQERKRVAAELHDGLGQDLLLIKNRLSLAVSRRANATESNQQIDAAVAATNRAIKEIRAISHALRPAALDQVGLTMAIEGMVEQLAEGTRLKFSADLDPIDGLLAPEMEMNLFRIIQEGLNNILRHANATLVILEVKREETRLWVSLYDDGRGFDAARLLGASGLREGLGLTTMTERAKYIGGNLDIQSAPGRGTRVTVHIRLPDPKA